MPTPTIPARVLARALASICDARAREVERRADRPTRESPDPAARRAHAAARRREADALREQRRRLWALVAHGRGDVDAACAGLLCALATGYLDAARDLERHLSDTRHPAAAAVGGVPATSAAGWLECILARSHRR